MNVLKLLSVVLLVFLCFGCTGKKQIYEGLYDGLNKDMTLDQDPGKANPPYDEPISYEQYKLERKKLLEKDNKPGYLN